MSASVSQLSVYPIKSSAGLSLSNAWVDEYGLAFDRRFVITDESGKFITARTEPTLCLIRTSLTDTGLVVVAPDMPILRLNYRDFSSDYHSITVWNDTIEGQHCAESIDQWFSTYLKKPCRLMYFGDASQRKVKDSQQETAFSDGYPLLLISQASLDDLNTRLSEPVTMAHFRPNIVVENTEDFAEDTWQHIRIGEVEFMVTKPCSRCVFTTINPNTAHKSITQEPLKTLKLYRQVLNGDVMFGQNLIPLNQGQIKTTDTVTVLKTKTPPRFMVKKSSAPVAEPNNVKNRDALITQPSIKAASNTTPDNPLTAAQKKDKKKVPAKVNINYQSWNKVVKGNTKASILEQGEDAALILPYSCRAGMCGRCKMKLIDGDVRVLADDGLTDDEKNEGYILSCSCIPQSDITLLKP